MTEELLHLPKISIVTPSFNQGQYIEQTILSILNQGYPNLEYIIIDGGSTDNTVEIIKKYEQHISYWTSEPDKGQSDALNKGLSKCTGDIFNWINSDDYLKPGALLKVAQTFNSNPVMHIVCGYSDIFEDKTQKTIQYHRSEIFASVEQTLVQQRINQQGTFYRLDIVRLLGGLNESLHYVMDLELWFKYLCKFGQHKILLIDDVLTGFRIHASSKTFEFEERFRKEEKGLIFYLLHQLHARGRFFQFFKPNLSYKTNRWDVAAIKKKKIMAELSRHYFFQFYKKKCFSATRTAFFYRFRAGDMPLNKHVFRIFIKSFFGV